MVAIKDYKLQGFISDTNSQPLKYLIQEDQTHDKINPDFLDWKQQDQLLVSWIFVIND